MHDDIIHTRWHKLKWDGITKEEQGYLMFWWLTSEVVNGTFDQYFANETGDHALVALDFCRRNGLEKPRQLIQNAIDALAPFGGYKCDWEERRKTMMRLWDIPEHSKEKLIRSISDEMQDECGKYLEEAASIVIGRLKSENVIS